MTTKITNSERVNFQVHGKERENGVFSISGARTIPNLSLPCQSLREKDIKGHRHLNNIDIRCFMKPDLEMIIGQHHWNLIISREIGGTARDANVASRTSLRWVVHGYAIPAMLDSHRRDSFLLRNESNPDDVTTSDSKEKYDDELHIVKAGFSLEAIGTTVGSLKNALIERAEHVITITSRHLGDKWETGLLWKTENI